ncbi:MAG: hypothetical protein JNK65_07830 [Deltaproteobacteria bacterium]|nr:hypothetical protein [Deltaproteobacteria bacterium]
MLPILIIGGIAAVTLLSGCSRRQEETPSETPPCHSPQTYTPPQIPASTGFSQSTPSPSTSSGVFQNQRSLLLRNAQTEYQNLCRVLFNKTNPEECNAIRPSTALREPPSQNQGLNAYYQGILQRQPGYSFSYADTQGSWNPFLHQLEGASLYLAGHGGCPTGTAHQDTCIPLNDTRNVPAIFDFADDYYNLMGTFFFLQANQNTIQTGASCTLVGATLGTDDQPFCHAFSRHNIVLTPVSNNLRQVRPEHVNLSGLTQSHCDAR